MTASPFLTQKDASLYEADYLAWIATTVQHLKQGDYDSVAWENLIDEIEDMGRSEKHRLKSNLIVVLLHLLKWEYQRSHRSRSWAGSIIEHRGRIQDALKDSPSLKPYLEDILAEAYTRALKQALAETGLPADTFPAECDYEIAQILNDDFLPQ
jgi:Domain of unknown function DUF29